MRIHQTTLLLLAALIGAAVPAQAQTVRYLQTFNALPTNALWDNNLDTAKPTAHPENILVTAGCGEDSSNCLKQVYRHFDGIHKQPASSPVFATDTGGKVIWAPSDAGHTNTATDVIQANIMVSGTTSGTSSANATPVPSKAYTLTYKVLFESGFDFAKGGKLPGLAAKAFDSGCTEDGSAKRSGSSWSVRLMWRANGRVELYSYDQSRPSGSCGINTLIDHVAGEPPYEVPGQIPPGSTKFRFKTNVWYTVTLGVKVNDNNSVVYQKDGSGNNVLDSLGDPIPLGGNGAEYLMISGADGSVATLENTGVALRDECNGACPASVPDTPATWVNALFYSSFHGGNETKRVQCLTAAAPSFPGLTQARYDQLCASQHNAAIFPALTWNPMTYTAARFDDFKVVEGYPGGSDTLAPSAPAGLTASAASASQVNLAWAASSDNVGVTGYRVYRAGVLVGSPAGLTFSDTGLAASTLYSYTVKATDAAGNLSGASNTASATTQAGGGGGTSVTLSPSDDAYTRDSGNAANNYGSDTLLILKTDSLGGNRHAYLKFNLASVGTVNSAKLRVYGSASATTTLTAYQAADGWTNSTLTWNNAPAAGASAGTVALSATAKYYEIDVTAYVQAQAAGDDAVTLVLKESAGKYTTFNSSNNGANQPQLVVN